MNRLPLPTSSCRSVFRKSETPLTAGAVHQDLDPADQPDGALQFHRSRAPVTATKAVS